MPSKTGTYDINSLLANKFQSVAEFGVDTIQQVLEDDLAAHNELVMEMVSEICELTVDRQRIYGTSATGDMQETDEFGKTPTQKEVVGSTVAFPLKLFQYNIGWTSKWMQTKTPADLAISTLAAEKAHKREIIRQIKKAIFASANYSYTDHLVDKVALACKRFVNADSEPIPDGPNGEAFDGATHTHFTANAGLTAPVALACVDNVIEHGHGGSVKLAISRTDEAAFRLLPGFVAYQDPRLVFGASTTGIPEQRLDIARLDNRAIGIFGGAEVWVQSWAIANYVFVWDADDPQKPLAFRQRNAEAIQGLRVAAENDDYPLYAKDMEAEFGIAVWARTNGAALYFGAVAWADPTIA